MYRSLLFVPMGDVKKAEKAVSLNCDGVIFDLEDGVPAAGKNEARENLAALLREWDLPEDWEILVRINGLRTPFGLRDLMTVSQLGDRFSQILLPKVENEIDVILLDEMLHMFSLSYGHPVENLGIMALIESSRGVLNVEKIAGASPRLKGIMFGVVDYRKDVRCGTTAEGIELVYPATKIVLAARGCGLIAIDAPYTNLRDIEGFEKNVRMARMLGFDGKALIHPSQIDFVNEVFSPSEEEIAWAKKVLEVFGREDGSKKGPTLIDGELVEELHVEIAKRILGMEDIRRD